MTGLLKISRSRTARSGPMAGPRLVLRTASGGIQIPALPKLLYHVCGSAVRSFLDQMYLRSHFLGYDDSQDVAAASSAHFMSR